MGVACFEKLSKHITKLPSGNQFTFSPAAQKPALSRHNLAAQGSISLLTLGQVKIKIKSGREVIFIYLLIWLPGVLAAAVGLRSCDSPVPSLQHAGSLVAARQLLSCGMWPP